MAVELGLTPDRRRSLALPWVYSGVARRRDAIWRAHERRSMLAYYGSLSKASRVFPAFPAWAGGEVPPHHSPRRGPGAAGCPPPVEAPVPTRVEGAHRSSPAACSVRSRPSSRPHPARPTSASPLSWCVRLPPEPAVDHAHPPCRRVGAPSRGWRRRPAPPSARCAARGCARPASAHRQASLRTPPARSGARGAAPTDEAATTPLPRPAPLATGDRSTLPSGQAPVEVHLALGMGAGPRPRLRRRH